MDIPPVCYKYYHQPVAHFTTLGVLRAYICIPYSSSFLLGYFGSPRSLRDPGPFPGQETLVESEARVKTPHRLEAHTAGLGDPFPSTSPG
jgi:hypothetical protein